MEQKELSDVKAVSLDFGDVPSGYALCFNGDCPQCAQCMRYVAGQLAPEARLSGPSVYPAAWRGAACSQYRPLRRIERACGFGGLYAGLPRHLRAVARRSVTSYLGSVGTYYRYHDGERWLSPEQQQGVADVVRRYGACADRPFDRYQPGFDFG